MSTPMPTLSSSDGLQRYLQEIKQFPILEKDEEYMLATAWVNHRDPEAGYKLLTSHLRLAASEARKFSRFGAPKEDLIQEANIGLNRALHRYDPDKNSRFATYALWWIQAALKDFLRNTWSLVKIGTTAAQRNLFFNLWREKRKLGVSPHQRLTHEQAEEIIEARKAASSKPESVKITVDDVLTMDERLRSGGDQSLNAPLRGDDDSAAEWQDMQVDEGADQALAYAEREEAESRGQLLQEALASLNERERDIIVSRRLHEEEDQLTLEDLSQRYGVSRERIRQIENRAMERLRVFMQERMINL